jgi:hypothetical protein
MVAIDSTELISKFIFEVDSLHDALVHEAVLLHPGYVDQDRRMWGDAGLPDARLIFQSQSPDFAAVQINLARVASFRLDLSLDFRLEADIEKDGIVLYPSGKSNAHRSEIRAARCEYTMLGIEFLGSEYRMVCSTARESNEEQ